MSTRNKKLTVLSLLGLMLSLSMTAFAQVRAYQVSDRQVQTLLDRIETRSNIFRTEVDRTLDQGSRDGTNREDSINNLIANYETATDRLRDNFTNRRSTMADAQEVLNRAAFVDRFMKNNRVSTRAQNEWSMLRRDLDTLAGYYRIQSNWNVVVPTPGSTGGYYATDAQLRTLLNRLSTRSTSFRQTYDRWARNGRGDQNITQDIRDLEREVNDLRIAYRNSNSTGVEEVLREAASVNAYISDRDNRTTASVNNRWNLVRNDLNTLASYYRVAWNWDNNTGYPGPGNTVGSFDSQITGTYRLNTTQSDNVTTVVDRAIVNANYNVNQRDRIRRNLERRLISPNMLMIEKRGSMVTLSANNGASVNLTADGTSRSETSPNGRTVRTSVTANNRDLTINYEGDRMNDYYVTFMPMNNGQLRVSRRVYLENQNDTVTVMSVYDKTSPTTNWNTAVYPPNTGGTPTGGFYIPNNTGIVATLNTPISTKTARDGDRFSMTVTSPTQYRDAVIEGSVVGERSGVFSGRASLQLSFDTIRLRNGQSYRFAGIVDQVREADGDVVSVTNEGTIRDGSQTTRTATRAGIGAILGAIIGAVAGGGSGAAIGAGVGAGAGAGTVILQGRDNLELESGSVFTITATAPSNVAYR